MSTEKQPKCFLISSNISENNSLRFHFIKEKCIKKEPPPPIIHYGEKFPKEIS
jgi:hypothetical protein